MMPRIRYDMTVFDNHFADMWHFSEAHFGHGFLYSVDYYNDTFIIRFTSENEHSFFLLYWGDKVNALSNV